MIGIGPGATRLLRNRMKRNSIILRISILLHTNTPIYGKMMHFQYIGLPSTIHIPIAHRAANHHSFDPTISRKVNRVLTDHYSGLFSCPPSSSGKPCGRGSYATASTSARTWWSTDGIWWTHSAVFYHEYYLKWLINLGRSLREWPRSSRMQELSKCEQKLTGVDAPKFVKGGTRRI